MASYEQPWELLWMCNLCNLVLAVGLLAGSRRLVWLATLWLVVGAPLWVWDMTVRGGVFPHSFLTHIAAPALGLWALFGRAPAPGVWKAAALFGLAAQAACRVLSPPALNINASHVPYQGLQGLFAGSYAAYWAANLLVLGAVLYAVERLMARILARR